MKMRIAPTFQVALLAGVAICGAFGSYSQQGQQGWYSDCDCQPVWKCPQAANHYPMRFCRYLGFIEGYCCPGGMQGCDAEKGSEYGSSSSCTPLVQCPAVIANPSRFVGRGCSLADGSQGVMCSELATNPMMFATRREEAKANMPLAFVRTLEESFAAIDSRADVSEAVGLAEEFVSEQVSLENELVSQGRTSPANTPSSVFNLNSRSSEAVQALGLQGLQQLQTLINVAGDQTFSMFNRDFNESDAGNQFQASAQQELLIPGCQPEKPIVCDGSIYRTTTGECNNPIDPRQGRSLTGFKRLLPNAYEDGIFAIRSSSVQGGELPSPRLISERLIETISRELHGFTLSVMQWGQFIDHDFNHALVFRVGEETIECCEDEGRTFPDQLLHPQCIPIPIPADDPFYSQFGQRCMTLTRSMPAPEPNCIAKPATPINELTAFLDASMLYGSENAQLNSLRSFQGGRMIVTCNNMLPFRDTPSAQRLRHSNSRLGVGNEDPEFELGDPCRQDAQVCFRAGDARVNEQSGLTVMHTLFTREHNRIADALQLNHPNWDDEKVFQETRRIVIAEWQHIIYNEWLPIVIGYDYARDHYLLPIQFGYSNFYDPNIDASAANEFATAAFRFGHSMVREMYELINASGFIVGSINITRTFFDPTIVALRFTEHARTLVVGRPETFDANVISSLHEQLFTTNFMFGLDLMALNIQRGRDHGIPTYVSLVEACSNQIINSWADLSHRMDSQTIDQLRSVYADVRDVDLFIGGLAEQRAPGAQVGPTFQCIIAQQFFDVRFGDRFFYDNGNQPHSFTPRQLQEIRKSSWARMMCDTLSPQFGGDFFQVQPLAFVEAGFGPNNVAGCNSLAVPSMDLSVF